MSTSLSGSLFLPFSVDSLTIIPRCFLFVKLFFSFFETFFSGFSCSPGPSAFLFRFFAAFFKATCLVYHLFPLLSTLFSHFFQNFFTFSFPSYLYNSIKFNNGYSPAIQRFCQVMELPLKKVKWRPPPIGVWDHLDLVTNIIKEIY